MAQRKSAAPLVGVVMGSDSDWEVMQHAVAQLDALGIPFETRVVSAHRMPDDMFEYAEDAARARPARSSSPAPAAPRICPGMLAAKTTVPVLGVPVPSKYLRGEDSLLFDRADAEGHSRSRRSRSARRAPRMPRLFAGAHPRGHRRRAREAGSRRSAQSSRRDAARARCACRLRHDRDVSERARGDSAGRMARASRRRPARPHVLHGGAEPGLQGRGARPGQRQPGGQRRRPALHADYLDKAGLARLASLVPRGNDRVRERSRRRARIPRARARGSRRPPQASRSRRTASARRRFSPTTASTSRRSPCCAAPTTRAASIAALVPGIVKSARMGYDGKGQIRVASVADVDPAFAAMRGQPCVLEKLRRPRLRSLGDRRAQRARRDVDVAGGREPPSRRHPRRLDRAGARRGRSSRRARATSPRAVADRARLPRRALRRDVRHGRRRAAGQRDRAAAAQQRPLHDRRVRHVAVRAAGARPRRPAARRSVAAHAAVMVNLLGDLWFDGPDANAPREPDWTAVLAPSAREAASLRQGRAAPRAQDGTRDLPRRAARRRARDRARDQGSAGHSRADAL